MMKAAFLLLSLFAAPTQATVFRKPAEHTTGFVQASTDAGMIEQIRAGIVSTSMQDSLKLISTLKEDEERESPSIAIPGQWLTDQKKAFLFLPLKLPKEMPLGDMKLLTNGRQLLVNTVSRSPELPEDEATKKFRLVLAAFKAESAGDESVLTQKLNEWYQDEEEEEVRNLIKQTLDGLNFADGEKPRMPQAVEIPLNTLELSSLRKLIADAHRSHGEEGNHGFKFVAPKVTNPHGGTVTVSLKGTYLQVKEQDKKKDALPLGGSDTGSSMTSAGWSGGEPSLVSVPLDSEFLQKLISTADYVVPLAQEQHAPQTTQIQESISIVIPYPVAPGRVFAVLAESGQLVITMPFKSESLTAKGDDAFVRVPVFDIKGDKLVGLGPGGPAETVLSPESAEKDHKLVKPTATDATAVVAKPPAKMQKEKDAVAAVPVPNKAEEAAGVVKAAAAELAPKDTIPKKKPLASKK